MKPSIVILHFGKLETTQSCVKSVVKYEKNASIIIVNNNPSPLRSSDFSKTPVIIINNPKNVGFAAGVNIGIKYALSRHADSILLLNNDTLLSMPLLSQLCKAFGEHESIGIVGPAIAFEKKGKKLYDLGGYVNMLLGKTRHNNQRKIPFEVLQFPEYVSGCCMLIKKEVFEKIGYFDERFFLYYEDVDFCIRAKKKNFAIALDPQALLYHSLSKTAGKNSKTTLYHQTRSAILFGRKYFKKSPKILLSSLFIVLQSLLFLKNNPSTGWAAFQAIRDTRNG